MSEEISTSDGLLKELEKLRIENAELRQQLDHHKTLKTLPAMSLDEFQRYGRQMIVEETEGLDGQMKLKNAKVLVVGAGGLGCPALPYLAGAGVGTIGIVDDDIVDISNLHRQVLHDSTKVGTLKCQSAKQVLNKLNPHVDIVTYPVRLSNDNAFNIFDGYQIVLDCTDTPMTRYLVSDVAVMLGITVVSASALRTEGQLSILNFANKGPCYRCFYPTAPAPTSVSSCQEGGVLGPCVGLIGVAMAVETIKLILGTYTEDNFEPFLMQYSGFPRQTMRTFKMRGRKSDCACCGKSPTITRQAIESGLINYQAFCGSRHYNVLVEEERISVNTFEKEYMQRGASKKHILLDVRPNLHFSISHLPNTYNISVKDLRNMEGDFNKLKQVIPIIEKTSELLVMCRYGNDSQLATRLLKDQFQIGNVRDIKGGYFKYIDDINPELPKY